MLDKLKEIVESKNKTVYVLLIAIFIVFLIAIIVIILMWKNSIDDMVNKSDKEEVINFSTGFYDKIDISKKDVVQKYSLNVMILLQNNNYQALYKLLSKEFIEYNDMNEEKFKKYLEDKKIVSTLLVADKYITKRHNRLGNIFEVDFARLDNVAKEKIIFIEESPNNYTISFDSFISSRKIDKQIIRDGITMNLKSIKEFVTYVEYDCSFVNNSKGNFIINKLGNREPFALKLSSDTVLNTISDIFSYREKEMKPRTMYTTNLKFTVERLNSGLAKSIVLKDVYSEITKETKDIEFELD